MEKHMEIDSLDQKMKEKMSKESKVIRRCLKAPLKVMIKIRDLYINGMYACAGRVHLGAGMGAPTGVHVTTLPKSFSVNSVGSSSRDDDFAELVRVASTRSLGAKVEVEFLLRQQTPSPPGVKVVPRSQSVGIGRIDEDKPCEFGDDDAKLNPEMFPRSRSHVVSRRNIVHNL